MTAATSPTLLFDWGPPRRRARAIVIFVLASLLLHALCFYIFQIVYPPTVVLLPPPAHVSLITAATDEGRALLRWVDAEDPALASATLRPADSKLRVLPKVQHIPSYINERAALKEPPPLVVDLRPPSAQPPGPVPTITQESKPAPALIATNVAFSEELAALGKAHFPPTKFSAATNEQPENVRFRIGVNLRGEVRFCFPLNSSGDPSLNNQARQHLALTRFFVNSPRSAESPAQAESNSETLVWGIATVEWGNDVVRPQAKSTSSTP
jgi:hypothetical protein